MADTVNQSVVANTKRYYNVHRSCMSDGTGETDATVVDVSTLVDAMGRVCDYSVVDRIEYSVWGMSYVLVKWDHTTDDEIAVLSGQGVIDWSDMGGKVDPKTAGGTGDILLSSVGATAGGGYDITFITRKKSTFAP